MNAGKEGLLCLPILMIVLQESQDFAGRWTTTIPSDKKLSR
jgi:hypothetical protein